VVPMKTGFQWAKKLVKGRRNSYDLKHGAVLPKPMVSGRYIHSLTIGGELPLLPLLSSPIRHFAPKSQST
jgi:hypothetical protein